MKSMSRSVEAIGWRSSVWVDSRQLPGVRYRLARISLVRRLEITARVRGLAAELEFSQAGQGLDDRLRARALECAIDRIYVEWGLLAVEGLTIDGEAPTPALLLERGPEALSREIADAIRRDCFLSGEERKN
jgi:hypothetical protein